MKIEHDIDDLRRTALYLQEFLSNDSNMPAIELVEDIFDQLWHAKFKKAYGAFVYIDEKDKAYLNTVGYDEGDTYEKTLLIHSSSNLITKEEKGARIAECVIVEVKSE